MPQLPEPNIHPSPKFPTPKDFYAFLAPSITKKITAVSSGAVPLGGSSHLSSSIKLAKAPGIASLNIELSWRYSFHCLCLHRWLTTLTFPWSRPTVRGTYVPTHEQLAAVLAPTREDSEAGSAKNTIERFAVELERVHKSPPPFFREDGETCTPTHLHSFGGHDGLILTRAERQLVRGTFRSAVRESQGAGANSEPEPRSLNPPSFYTRRESHDGPLIHINGLRLSRNLRLDEPRPSHSQYSSLHLDNAITSQPFASNNPHGVPTSELPAPVSPQAPFAEIAGIQPNLKSAYASVGMADNSVFSARAETTPMDIVNAITAATSTADNSLSKSVIASISRFRRLQDQTVPGQVTFHDKIDETERRTLVSPQLDEPQASAHHLPLDLLCDAEMRLPEPWQRPVSRHLYMASLGLIQKRALASALSSEELGCIWLIERAELEEDYQPDLIIDPHRIVLFVPILHLPTSNQELMSRLKHLLASYSKILLIFEAYPSSHSFGSASSRVRATRHIAGKKAVRPLELDSFSPPVLSALKRFRRELTIERELAGHDRADMKIQVVCARNIDEAAMYARLWGNQAEVGCDGEPASILWDQRTWLNEGEAEVLAVLLPSLHA